MILNLIPDPFFWKADEDFDSGIIKTIEWYLKKYKAVKSD